jgi:hypothetical protein
MDSITSPDRLYRRELNLAVPADERQPQVQGRRRNNAIGQIRDLRPSNLAHGLCHLPVEGNFDQHSILTVNGCQKAIKRSRVNTSFLA